MLPEAIGHYTQCVGTWLDSKQEFTCLAGMSGNAEGLTFRSRCDHSARNRCAARIENHALDGRRQQRLGAQPRHYCYSCHQQTGESDASHRTNPPLKYANDLQLKFECTAGFM